MPASLLRYNPGLLRISDRYWRLLPSAAEIVLSVLVAHAAALLVWQLVPLPEGSGWTAPVALAADTLPATSGPNVELIASAHLFGQYEAPAAPALTELDAAPDTQLNLTLMGILSQTAERGSRALIASSSGEEKSYAVGDDIERNTSLHSVFPDRVILVRAGRFETLRLDKNAPRKNVSSSDDGDQDEEPVGDTTANMLNAVRAELLADPSRAADFIRAQPASSGGQMRGYRVYPGRDRSAFTAAGLRPGDLVTQVNGIQLNDPSTALQMLSQLSSAGALTVVVERGGEQQTINVNFQ